MTTINDKWIDFAIRLQSIAQAGLQYGKDKYDIEEEDFLSAELEIVPAGKARECGLDRSINDFS